MFQNLPKVQSHTLAAEFTRQAFKQFSSDEDSHEVGAAVVAASIHQFRLSIERLGAQLLKALAESKAGGK